MASKIKEIEKQVLQLPTHERGIIGEKFFIAQIKEDEEEDPACGIALD